jgi:TP53 regulating kinase-like protein
MVDVNEGVLGIEWIDGKSVRQLLPGGAELEDINELEEVDEIYENGAADPIADYGVSRGRTVCTPIGLCSSSVDALMDMIGVEIAKMHLADIIHGDLTTSNMMLRKQTSDLVHDRIEDAVVFLMSFSGSYRFWTRISFYSRRG